MKIIDKESKSDYILPNQNKQGSEANQADQSIKGAQDTVYQLQ